MIGMGGGTEAWEDDGDTSSHRFAAIERSLCRHEQPFYRLRAGRAT